MPPLTLKLKDTVRREARGKLLALSPKERHTKSLAIKKKLFSLTEFKKAKRVLFFVSLQTEVETETMIREALSQGKTVVVPVVDEKRRRLSLSEIRDIDLELTSGPWGLRQPKKEYLREVKVGDLDLLVVPGMAYDEQGHRVGRGAGYYDRLLPLREKDALAAALAFEVQVMSSVPWQDRDVSVDMIITEKRTLRCRGGKR